MIAETETYDLILVVNGVEEVNPYRGFYVDVPNFHKQLGWAGSSLFDFFSIHQFKLRHAILNRIVR